LPVGFLRHGHQSFEELITMMKKKSPISDKEIEVKSKLRRFGDAELVAPQQCLYLLHRTKIDYMIENKG
jgi:hypothetical protein